MCLQLLDCALTMVKVANFMLHIFTTIKKKVNVESFLLRLERWETSKVPSSVVPLSCPNPGLAPQC